MADYSRLHDPRPRTRAEGRRRLRQQRIGLVVLFVIILLLFVGGYFYSPNRPWTYDDDVENFKYGSIGSDIENGLPMRAMRVIPKVFKEYLPNRDGPQDWTNVGFIQEPGHDMPIGFSRRRRVIDLVALNCAACHTGLVRKSAEERGIIYLGMPANTVDLQAFFQFLFRCADDPAFETKVLDAMEEDGGLFYLERKFIYGPALELMRKGLMRRRNQLAAYMTSDHPRWGPGRVDTFNPYKVNHFASYYGDDSDTEKVEAYIPVAERHGTVDFPSVWNQRPREGLQLHWDGNNTSVSERNISAALGAGATRENIDLSNVDRIRKWMDDLPPPPYPFETPASEAIARGEHIYLQYCFRCHDFSGAEVGRVVNIRDIGTDPARWQSYTQKLANIQADYGRGYGWEWKNFKKTDGYSNQPLDGLWARAGYLHNGSVPSLMDLLTSAEDRPKQFDTGHGVYDEKNLGFKTEIGSIRNRHPFRFDTTLPGNSNAGHTGPEYGTDLPVRDKEALVAYFKAARPLSAERSVVRRSLTQVPVESENARYVDSPYQQRKLSK